MSRLGNHRSQGVKTGKLSLSQVIITSIVLFFAVSNLRSQDIIIKKDSEEIKAKILEIGTTEIKYKLFDLPDGPTMTILKKDVKTLKIKAQNGKVISMDESRPDPMSVSNAAIADKTSSLKFNFFSPITQQLAFSYEWMIKPGFNWETGLSIVGPGVEYNNQNTDFNPRGLILRTGCKFLLGNSSDIEIEGAKYAHPLKGRYFKIETILYDISTNYNSYNTNYNYYYNNGGNTMVPVSDNFVGATFDIVYGRQWIFGNSITVGWYVGLGYVAESKTFSGSGQDLDTGGRYAFDTYNYSPSSNNKIPIMATFGFNIGLIFKTPYWLSNLTSPRVSNTAPSRHSLSND